MDKNLFMFVVFAWQYSTLSMITLSLPVINVYTSGKVETVVSIEATRTQDMIWLRTGQQAARTRTPSNTKGRIEVTMASLTNLDFKIRPHHDIIGISLHQMMQKTGCSQPNWLALL